MQINISNTLDKSADNKLRIKKKAGDAILAIAPEWKQRNMTAKALELTEIIANGGTLTVSQQAEMNAVKLIWSQISAIRAASDTAENDGTLSVDFNP